MPGAERLIGGNPHPLVSARSYLLIFPSVGFAQGYRIPKASRNVGFSEFTRFFNRGYPRKLQIFTATRSTIELPGKLTYFRQIKEKSQDQKPNKKSRQCPTLPQSCPCSTIGAGELNFRVRNGNGCFLPALTTGKNLLSLNQFRILALR